MSRGDEILLLKERKTEGVMQLAAVGKYSQPVTENLDRLIGPAQFRKTEEEKLAGSGILRTQLESAARFGQRGFQLVLPGQRYPQFQVGGAIERTQFDSALGMRKRFTPSAQVIQNQRREPARDRTGGIGGDCLGRFHQGSIELARGSQFESRENVLRRRTDDPKRRKAVHRPSQEENAERALNYPASACQPLPTNRAEKTERHEQGQSIEGLHLRIGSHLQGHKDQPEHDRSTGSGQDEQIDGRFANETPKRNGRASQNEQRRQRAPENSRPP